MRPISKAVKYVALAVGAAAVVKNREKIRDEIAKALDRANEFMDRLEKKNDGSEKEETDNDGSEAGMTMEDCIRESFVQAEESGNQSLKNHLGDEIVVTDTWATAQEERELGEEELLPGELSAMVFTVGCYQVKLAQKVYYGVGGKIDLNKPAEEAGTALAARLAELSENIDMGFYLRMERAMEAPFGVRESGMTFTKEVSAKYLFWEGDFIPVCRADLSSYTSWFESISYIGAAKVNSAVSDKKASLFVCMSDMGSSYTVKHWYRLSLDRTMKEYEEHGMEPDSWTEPWEIE